LRRLQEVARKHSKAPQYWALDEMVYHTEPTQMKDSVQVTSTPNEGCFMHGLTMDGAAFDMKAGIVVEVHEGNRKKTSLN
jgi:hypothetical protein